MMRFTPSFISLDPSIPYAADPAAAMPSDRPFLFTDLSQVGSTPTASIDGSLVVDGSTFRGVTQFSLTIDDAWEPIFGDSTTLRLPAGERWSAGRCHDLLRRRRPGPVEHIGLRHRVADSRHPADQGRPAARIVHGDRAPAHSRVYAHAYREVVATVPGVKWEIPPHTAALPGGGAAEIALSGMMRPVSGQPAYTVDVLTDSAIVAFTT